MKTLIVIGMILGLLVFAGLVMAYVQKEDSSVSNEEALCENSCPLERCTASNNCGLPSCGVAQGSSCGCGGR